MWTNRQLDIGNASFLAIVVLSCLACFEAYSAVLSVSPNGEDGSFSEIQSAISAAAAGDTILIESGQYFETHPFQADCCNLFPTVAGVDKPNLTIMGVARDSVIIGPDVRSSEDVGIAMHLPTGEGLTIQSLTLRNLRTGVRIAKHANLRDLRFTECVDGVFSFADSNVVIDGCVFEGNQSRAAYSLSGSKGFRVVRSSFDSNPVALDYFQSKDAVVQQCIIRGGDVAVNIGNGSRVRIEHSRIEASPRIGMALLSNTNTEIVDTWIEGRQAAIDAIGASRIYARRCTFAEGEEFATLWLQFQGPVDMRQNNILGTGPYRVRLHDYPEFNGNIEIDLGSNYWGTTIGALDSLILDGNDNPGIHGWVIYEPVLDTLVPVRRQSLGRLKSLYGQLDTQQN